MPAGRPTLYESSYAEQAYKFCLMGATNEEIAEHFGINVGTLYEWQKKYPDLAEALKKGKRPANAEVSHALFERAKGLTFIEQQAIKVKEVIYEKGKRVSETEHVEVVPVERHIPPDPTSMIFFLKNREKQNWRDKQDYEVTGKDGGPQQHEVTVTDSEAKAKMERRLQKIAERQKPTT